MPEDINNNQIKWGNFLAPVIAFADKAHGDQLRRYSNDRYITHPVRVMKLCSRYTDHIPTLAAAILHDVLEDTPVTEDELSSFLHSIYDTNTADQTLSIVIELTDVFIRSNYPQHNRRHRKKLEAERLTSCSAEAQTVKYADIIDNSPDTAKHDPEFAYKFLREYRQLLKALDKGNSLLRGVAMDVVETEITSLTWRPQ